MALMSGLYVCVKDGRALRVKQNSVYSEQLTEGDPYRVYSGDLWSCPECDFEVLVTAPMHSWEYWEDNYSERAQRATVKFH